VRQRLILLSHLVPSISAWSVWDLPLWAWRGYAHFHDEYIRSREEG
jgi:hypothetical protein